MGQTSIGAAVCMAGLVACGALAAGDEGGAVVPGQLEARPTLECVGLYWPVAGDLNGNATAAVEYRQGGDATWRKAMDLLRVAPRKVDYDKRTVDGHRAAMLVKPGRRTGNYQAQAFRQNYLAGSIFNLMPGTRYEFRVALHDPDGGGKTVTIAASTRCVPVTPAKGNVIPVRGGGDALRKAVAGARPGDAFLVHAGTYNGPVIVTASGSADRPIVIRSAGDGEVVIHGPKGAQAGPKWSPREDKEGATDCVNLAGSHIRFHGIHVHGGFIGIYTGIRRQPPKIKDISITRCTFTGCFHGVFGKASQSYVADNVVLGTTTGGNEGEGVELIGTGNVICYNRIRKVADGVSIYSGSSDSDVYGNDIYGCIDDGIEPDYAGPNIRLWANRLFYTGENGISFQPAIGGPTYVVRNELYGFGEDAFKVRYASAGAIVINNTLYTRRGPNPLPERTCARNNLFLTGSSAAMLHQDADLQRKTLDADYNGYDGGILSYTNRRRPERATPLAKFQTDTGLERHGLRVDKNELFVAPVPPQGAWWRKPAPTLPDFRLKNGSAAIDKGVVVPGIVETFTGKAPDLGAIEFGSEPHYGPRERSGG